MKAMSKLLLLLLISSCNSQTVSVDDLINQIFQNNPKTTFKPMPTKTTILNSNSSSSSRSGQTITYKSCGLNKECVPRHLCKDDVISTTGEGIIDIRSNTNVCLYNEKCCDVPNKTNLPIVPAKPREQHNGCGWRNEDGVGFKITNKVDEAEFGEFPWMVAILRVEEDGGNELIHLYECGGSLIAPHIILTAAHCVKNRKSDELIVRAGEWDTQNTNEILPFVDKPVDEIILHENYRTGVLYNDVALLVLHEAFAWEENIRPICLPPPHTKFESSNCFATGWGKDKFGRDGRYQVILKRIELPIVPHDLCQEQLRQTRLGLYFNLHESFLCAGGKKDQDTCKGDGGSPLVCPIPGFKKRYYQAGIVAWGVGCAEENVPGVYSDVAYLRQWISDKLISKNVDFSYFTASN